MRKKHVIVISVIAVVAILLTVSIIVISVNAFKNDVIDNEELYYTNEYVQHNCGKDASDFIPQQEALGKYVDLDFKIIEPTESNKNKTKYETVYFLKVKYEDYEKAKEKTKSEYNLLEYLSSTEPKLQANFAIDYITLNKNACIIVFNDEEKAISFVYVSCPLLSELDFAHFWKYSYWETPTSLVTFGDLGSYNGKTESGEVSKP